MAASPTPGVLFHGLWRAAEDVEIPSPPRPIARAGSLAIPLLPRCRRAGSCAEKTGKGRARRDRAAPSNEALALRDGRQPLPGYLLRLSVNQAKNFVVADCEVAYDLGEPNGKKCPTQLQRKGETAPLLALPVHRKCAHARQR